MIYLRCNASGTIGMGHLKRCLALAKSLSPLTQTCFIIPEPDKTIAEMVKAAGATLYTIPPDLPHAEEVRYYPDDIQNIIVDLGYQQNLEAPDDLVAYLQKLEEKECKVAILDGLQQESFKDPRTPKIKAWIQPYWNTDGETPPNAAHWLYGKDYVLLDKSYTEPAAFRQRTAIKNILITFGGADPQSNTIRVLQDITPLNRAKIHVIIGKFFDPDHIRQIKALQTQAADYVTLIEAPDHLLEYYQWADLCLCGSGTSRYEAAACGLPVIFTAIYPEHITLSQSFARYETAMYLGYYQEIPPHGWKNAITDLQKDVSHYKTMVEATKKLQQDKPGADAIAAELIRIFNDEKEH